MKSYLLIVALIGCALSLPIDDVAVQSPQNIEVKDESHRIKSPLASITKGDMSLSKELRRYLYSKKRSQLADPTQRWVDGKVFYIFDEGFSKYHKLDRNLHSK